MIASAGTLVLLGIAVGLIATVGRSTRGSALCPRCWYDMDGVDPQGDGRTVCPECGSVVWSPADLVRRKRWPILIAVAVAFQLSGQFSYQLIRADHGGAQNFVPTTVLVAGMFSLPSEVIIGAPSPFDAGTLSGRLANNRCAEWQKSWAIGKAIDALRRADHPDSVSRASTILSRCRFEGEIPFDAWKASMRLLWTVRAPGSAEAIGYLADSYVRARGLPEPGGRLSFATDPGRCATELGDLVPLLLVNVSTGTIRTQEWWAALRLLALAGDASAPIVPILEARILTEDSESGRANSAAVLAMLSAVLPDASEHTARAFASLNASEQPRVLNAIVRFIRPSPDMIPSFRVLASSSDPVLEVAGATALLGAPQTRCEGAELLIASLQRSLANASADLGAAYWPVLRDPSDAASTMLIVFLEHIALTATPALRAEAMAHLTNIARDAEIRSQRILAFLDFVGTEQNAEIAERARALAADVRTARGSPPTPRKVAVIR